MEHGGLKDFDALIADHQKKIAHHQLNRGKLLVGR
jgi:hypothetical protein